MMTARTQVARIALAACILAPFPAVGQGGPCRVENTVAECITLLERGAGQVVDVAATRAVQERVQSRSTGLGVGRAGTSIADFLPLLATMLGGPTGDLAEVLAADFTFRPDLDPVKPGGQPLRVRVIRHAPEPYAPLFASLPESVRVERAARVRDALGEFDDVEVSLAWSLESGRWGRSTEHQSSLLSSVFSKIVASAERQAAAAGIATNPAAVSTLLNELADEDFESGCDPDDAGDPRLLRLGCLKPGPRGRLVETLRVTLVGEAKLDSLVQSALVDRGFFRLGDLVNNQPQLIIEAHGRLRDSLVGPDVWGGSLRLEMGFANVNRLRSYCHREGRDDDPTLCLAEYLARPGVKAALGRGDRLWLSVDYAGTGAYDAVLLPDSVVLAAPPSHALTVSGGFGRYIGQTSGSLEAGRMDLTADYVFRIDDSVRENRFVASLTYTQRLTDAATLVLGVDYANKPEYLGEVDSKVGANVGVRYALHRVGAQGEGRQ